MLSSRHSVLKIKKHAVSCFLKSHQQAHHHTLVSTSQSLHDLSPSPRYIRHEPINTSADRGVKVTYGETDRIVTSKVMDKWVLQTCTGTFCDSCGWRHIGLVPYEWRWRKRPFWKTCYVGFSDRHSLETHGALTQMLIKKKTLIPYYFGTVTKSNPTAAEFAVQVNQISFTGIDNQLLRRPLWLATARRYVTSTRSTILLYDCKIV